MKDVKFIALPMNFTTTPYMRFVVGEHGFQAVGRIIALIEMLNEMDNEYNLKDKMQKTILSRGLKFDSEMEFDKFIELVSTLPDFKIERHIFSSRYIAEAQGKIEEKSVKAKKNIAARWNKQKYDRNTTVCDVDTTVLQENTAVSVCIKDEIRNDTYNNITEDNITEKKITKNTTPHHNITDNKTEVTYYNDKKEYESAVAAYKHNRYCQLVKQGTHDSKISSIVNAEVANLFILREEKE